MNCTVRPFESNVPPLPTVRGYLHVPENASGEGIVLTHGAGANCNSPLLVALARAFCEAGMAVLRCDLPFRQARPTGPPVRGSAEHDRDGLRAALHAMRSQVRGRVFIGGHSYGGRQATMLAAEEPELAPGLLLLSYPLHPLKKRDELRTAHFSSSRTPALFVHGSRDGFGTVEELTAALRLIPARTQLLPIVGAGHELAKAGKADEVAGVVMQEFRNFFR